MKYFGGMCVRWFFLDAHVSHLNDVDDNELNRLLGIVVDVENLFIWVRQEEDSDTKQVYFYLFKVRVCYDYVIFTFVLLCVFWSKLHHTLKISSGYFGLIWTYSNYGWRNYAKA